MRELVTFEITELRVDQSQGEPSRVRGHAAVFNDFSMPIGGRGGFLERIKPGAFAKSIGKDDVRALINHDSNLVLGRNKAGTLTMQEDSKGLLVDITLPDTSYARDLAVSMQRGDITQMSFGFETIKDAWMSEGDQDVRELHEVKLWDVSVVTFPAYPTTDAGVRSAEQIYAAREIDQEPPAEPKPDAALKAKTDFLEAIYKGE